MIPQQPQYPPPPQPPASGTKGPLIVVAVIAAVLALVVVALLFFIIGKSSTEKVQPASPTASASDTPRSPSPSSSSTSPRATRTGESSQKPSAAQAEELSSKALARLNARDPSGFAALWDDSSLAREKYDVMIDYLDTSPNWRAGTCTSKGNYFACQLYKGSDMAGTFIVQEVRLGSKITDWRLSLD